MADIGPGIAIAAGIAATALFQHIVVMGEVGVLHHQTAVPGHGHAVACHPGGIDAVKHVNAPGHALNQMIRGAHPHEVAGLVLGQVSRGILQHLIHEFLGLTYRKSAHSIAGEVKGRHFLGVPLTQVLVHAPLNNAEKPLMGSCHGSLATLGPAQGALRGALGILIVRRIRHTFIKGHDNVRAQAHLYLHGHLRREELPGTIQMRAEGHAFLRNFPELPQTKDLKSAAICQDSAIPVHELVQSSCLFHQFHARTQEQVIGVGKYNPRPQVLQFLGRNPLHRSLSAHRHEDRCRERAVRSMYDTSSGPGSLILLDELIGNRSQIKTSNCSIKLIQSHYLPFEGLQMSLKITEGVACRLQVP